MSKFKFELKAKVTISISGESGVVYARSESVNTKNQYLLSYKAVDGRAVSDWFYENEIKLTPVETKKAPVKSVTKKRPIPVKKAPAKKRGRKPAVPSV